MTTDDLVKLVGLTDSDLIDMWQRRPTEGALQWFGHEIIRCVCSRLGTQIGRLQRELSDLRRAQELGVAATPELIGVALDALATPADDVGDLP